MAGEFGGLARLWVETYGEQIQHLPLPRLVEIANQCIEAGLVPKMEKLRPEDGNRLLAELKAALTAAARARVEAEAALPPLTGTPNQIRWARQIRNQAIRNARMLRQRAKQHQDERTAARLDEYLANILHKKSSALWFIDNRWAFADFPGIVRRMPACLPQEQTSVAEQEARADMTLHPASGAQNRRAEIAVSGDGFVLMHPRDFVFLGVVSRHNLKWDPESLGWRGKLSISGETAVDRAAALAADLLAEGYAVMVSDDVTRMRAWEMAQQAVREKCERRKD